MSDETNPALTEAAALMGGETTDLIAENPKMPEEKRTAIAKRPGWIAFASKDGNYPGSRLVTFTGVNEPMVALGLDYETRKSWIDRRDTPSDLFAMSATEKVNDFFKCFGNLLVLGIWAEIGSIGYITVLYTNVLEEGEFEEFQEASRRVSMEMQKWKDERAAEREAEENEKRKAEKEAEEALAVAKKVKDHNLFGKLREQEVEIAQLKSELKKLRKKEK